MNRSDCTSIPTSRAGRPRALHDELFEVLAGPLGEPEAGELLA